ncbi:unnamed protein product [Effrenium voratum]|nr:unnamed protein product [Effrenium voratum]
MLSPVRLLAMEEEVPTLESWDSAGTTASERERLLSKEAETLEARPAKPARVIKTKGPAARLKGAEETLMAFASGDISGDRSHSGGSAFVGAPGSLEGSILALSITFTPNLEDASKVPKNADLAAKTRRLLLASVAAVIVGASKERVCFAFSGTEAEADEGRFIAAFQTLRRAQALARQSNTNGDRAEAALQGLRAAALQRWHFQMINDVPRGEQYGRAIEMAVAELLPQAPTGLLALDIGAGTGLLSLMCARLKGVREVHACEMNDALCAVAREVIAASQSCCPVTVHPVVSTSLQPREKFDLIFCEVFDAGLLGEHALPTLLHAKKALLKEGGILVPARATLFGQVVEAPGLLDRFSVRSPTGAALAGARLQNSERYTCETMWAVPHKKLTEAAKLVTLDFHQIEYLYSNLGNWIDPPIELSVCRTGEAHAFVFWWELELDAHGRCRIHTAPEGGSESWQQAVQPMAKAQLQEGQKVQLHLRLQADGMEVALQDEASGQARSSFTLLVAEVPKNPAWLKGVARLCRIDVVVAQPGLTDISSIYTVGLGARFPPDEGKIQGKDLAGKTDVSVAHVLDAQTGLGINFAVLAWHWSMVAIFLLTYFAVVCFTTALRPVPWLTLFQKLLVFWNLWEALGLGVISGPMHAKVNPPFQDWWYRFTVGTMKYNAPFMPCLSMRRNYLDIFVEGFLVYVLAIRVLLSPEVTPALMRPLTACLVYEFFFDHGQHMHTYGTQTMYCFVCMCFTAEQGQVVGLQIFMTWFYVCSGWCKIGPWFKYLNVSNLWSAKYMVSMPWSDWFRRVMYKGYTDPEPDYHLTRAASIFSAVCAVGETLGPMLVLFNDPEVVCFGIVFICCMHVYIISTLVVDVFTWNFVDALMYCFLFAFYGPSVGGPMGFQWQDLSTLHPVIAGTLLAHALYSIYGNFVPNHVAYVVAHRHAAGNFAMGNLLLKTSAAAKLGKVVAHSGCPVVKGAPAPGWFGEWLGFHLLFAYFWLWNLPHRMLLALTCDQLQFMEPEEDYILLHSVLVFDALAAHVRFDGLSSLSLVGELARVCGFEEGECTLCWVGAFQSFPRQLCGDATADWKVVDSVKGVLRQGTYTVQELSPMPIASIEPTDVPELQLEEEELLRFNDAKHWQMVQTALQAAFQRLEKRSVQLVDISESLPLALLQSASSDSCVAGVRGNTEKEVMKALLAAHSIDNEKVFLLVASPQQVIQAALPVPYPLKEDGQSIASIVLCEDVVAASGALRSEALEDLALLWRSCAGKLQREVLVVPEAITLKLALIQSHELERRTRVVERPGGVDVSSVNALSVPEFLGLEESLLQLQWLSAEVEALTLPLGEPLLTALAALSATGDNGQPLLRVKLVASCAGKVHGIATKFSWAGASEPGRQLAGVTWPGLPPELEAGDAVFASVRYSPCRGLVAADSAADAESQ